MNDSDIAFIQDMLQDAGEIALKYFRADASVIGLDNKAEPGSFDPVTLGDKGVEQALRDALSARFPQDAIVGEEFATQEGSSDRTWIIDPIDGTKAFVTGMLGWGMLLGLLENGVPRLGFMRQPYIDETFWGDGSQAWLTRHGTQRPLSTTSTTKIADATLYTTDPSMFSDPGQEAKYTALANQCRMRRFGGDCYAYSMLAHGQVDLVVENGLNPYDIVALIPIVQGAGGVVTNLEGDSAADGGYVVASATPSLHEQVLKILN